MRTRRWGLMLVALVLSGGWCTGVESAAPAPSDQVDASAVSDAGQASEAALLEAEAEARNRAHRIAAELAVEDTGEGHWGRFYNHPVVCYRGPVFGVPAEVRAERFPENLREVLERTNGATVGDITFHAHELGTVVVLNGEPLILVQEGDAAPGISTRETAEIVAERLRIAIQAWRDQRDPVKIGKAVLTVLGWTGLLLALVLILLRVRRRLSGWLRAGLGRKLSRVKARHVGRAGFAAMQVLAARAIDLGIVALVVVLSVVWLELTLAAFPYTRPIADQISHQISIAVIGVGHGAIAAMPDLFIAIIILVVTGVLVRAGASAIEQLARFEIGWLDDDTVTPTRRLFSISIWVLAIVMVYPYLPGSGTDAFKGISVLLGLMVSLGASSLVGQAASGMIVLYTRVLRPGEWVSIGDTEGRVVRIGIFATSLRLRSQEEVAVPNVQILSGKVTNHSRSTNGLSVMTAVTIGYDTPWRQVHALLLEAAAAVEGLRTEPQPFVLQSALDDFYVRYELRVVIDDPEQAPRFRHELHAAIQDAFNRHGVQIMSPHFRGQQGEEPIISPQERWYEPPAVPPAGAEPA